MLIDTIREYRKIKHKLSLEIRDDKERENLISFGRTDEVVYLLENLLKERTYQLCVFEMMLRIAPDEAICLLKERYLSLDLANHGNDQVSDLEIMFDDIKEILGKDKLRELLNDPEVLSENKENPRFIEAIEFAFDEEFL